MHKAKRFRKNNKLKVFVWSTIITVLSLVVALFVFNKWGNNFLGKSIDESSKMSNDVYKSSDECAIFSQNKDVAVPASADEKDIKNNKDTKDNSVTKKSDKGTNFEKWNNSCSKTLVVINKDNPVPSTYTPSIVDYKGIKVNEIIKDDLDKMISAAAKEGLELYPSSGYRSVERQTTLFNNQVSKWKNKGYSLSEAEKAAATVVAKPGTSEHHTGLAIDFNGVRDDFYKTKEYSWLIKNAANYGFILRYPKNKTDITNVIYEPWHFRYVGKNYAQKIAKSGLCYEEYIETIVMK